tara:strand:- start:26 stop:166 length:141 start_codon:yes stop_codon:yes gene_type:complete
MSLAIDEIKQLQLRILELETQEKEKEKENYKKKHQSTRILQSLTIY